MSIVLSGTAQNPLYIAGTTTVTGAAYGVLGNAGTAWLVTNAGTVAATGSNGIGVTLASGGYVTNQLGGTIYGTLDGIVLGNGGAVTNDGNIYGIHGDGIVLTAGTGGGSGGSGGCGGQWGGGQWGGGQWGGGQCGGGGSQSNGGSVGASGALVSNTGFIDAGNDGISVTTGSGVSPAVTNSGVITAGTIGILVNSGTSGSSGSGGCGGDGHQASGAGAVVEVDNFGFLNSYGTGIELNLGGGTGTVTNSGYVGGRVTGVLIEGSQSGGAGSLGSVVNSGEIKGGNTGVLIDGGSGAAQSGGHGCGSGGYGGSVGQGCGSHGGGGSGSGGSTASVGGATNSGGIFGYAFGVQIYGTNAGVTNRGTISAYAGVGLQINGAGAVVTNGGTGVDAGVIGGTAIGLQVNGANAVVVNATNGVIDGYPGGTAVMISGSAAAVTNAGAIRAGNIGVELGAGGYVSNLPGLGIYGGLDGVLISGGAGTVSNLGIIAATGSAGIGVGLAGGGSVVNGPSGATGALIGGYAVGLAVAGSASTVVNYGTIAGVVGFMGGTAGHATLVNAGTVASTVGGTAVAFAGSSDLLVVDPGAVFVGAVNGGGSAKLSFAAAGSDNVTGFAGFATVTLADGGANTLTLSDANFAGVTGQTIAVTGGNGGNTVNAAAVSAANKVVVHAGAGSDAITGGGGNDTLYAGGHTLLTGGAGSNVFVFSAPGNNTIADYAASATNEIAFSSNGFSLGLHGSSTPQALSSSLFVSNATGTFTSSSQRFAYETSNGDLFYSPHGNGSGASLVAQLSGDPSLTASHLFFVS